MQEYAQEFARVMDAEGIKYTVHDDHVINVSYTGENLKNISIYVFFDKEGSNHVQFYCGDIADFSSKEEVVALQVCNELNAEFRWVKFYVNKDKEVVATLDATLDITSSGDECVELLGRVVSIVDESFPKIAKARWA